MGRGWITCYLLTPAGDGYKPMSEDMGPYEYSCPMHFLEMVPDPKIGFSTDWREKVRFAVR